ncbi:MAG: hypothetical protein R6V84_03155 [Desulfobacterales bacterium]
MTQAGSRHMKIKLEVETANLVKVVDDDEKDATPVTPAEMEAIYGSPNGFRYVGTILQAKNSPGCMYIVIGNRTYKICT